MNHIFITGNLTRDPERQTTQSLTAIAKFTVANNDYQDKPIFVDCVAFNKLADNILLYTRKGSKVLVSGKLSFSEWEKEGVKHSRTEIIAINVEFLSLKEKVEDDMADMPFPEAKPKEKQPMSFGKKEEPKPVDNSDLPF